MRRQKGEEMSYGVTTKDLADSGITRIVMMPTKNICKDCIRKGMVSLKSEYKRELEARLKQEGIIPSEAKGK